MSDFDIIAQNTLFYSLKSDIITPSEGLSPEDALLQPSLSPSGMEHPSLNEDELALLSPSTLVAEDVLFVQSEQTSVSIDDSEQNFAAMAQDPLTGMPTNDPLEIEAAALSPTITWIGTVNTNPSLPNLNFAEINAPQGFTPGSTISVSWQLHNQGAATLSALGLS